MYDDFPAQQNYEKQDFMQSVYSVAAKRSVMPARILIENNPHMIRDRSAWFEPVIRDSEDAINKAGKIKLWDTERNPMILGDFSKSISDSVQFPFNTVFLHSLGCVSSAMVHNFRYDYYGNLKPVNLYTAVSQPPSTGKSQVNSGLIDPINDAYEEREAKHRKERDKIHKAIESLEEQMEKSKNEKEIDGIKEDIYKKTKELDEYPLYGGVVTDTTPEALESHLSKNDNTFKLISDEATALNTLLGLSYSDGKGKTSSEVILKSYDEEYMGSCRVGRTGFNGKPKGVIAVIAQDEVIESLLQIGTQRANGINERFLILKEDSLIGKRDFTKYTPISADLKDKYRTLSYNLVNAAKTTLTLSKDSFDLILSLRQMQEPSLADDGKFSHPVLRGTIGKMDKQIIKIACVLHAAKEWAHDGQKRTIIQEETIQDAFIVFDELLKTYIAATDALGFVGEMSEISYMYELLKKKKAKKPLLRPNEFISINEIRSAIKNNTMFKGKPKLTEYLKKTLLPECERHNFCVFNDDKIYLNPMLSS